MFGQFEDTHDAQYPDNNEVGGAFLATVTRARYEAHGEYNEEWKDG
jgi:hypothetical protein